MTNLIHVLRSLDAFPKTLDEFTVQTSRGACLSLGAIVTMLVLIVSELFFVLAVETTTELVVDDARLGELRINFDVRFPKTPCAGLSVDATDSSGKQRMHLEDHIWKKRLSRAGALVTIDEAHAIGGVVKHKLEFANRTDGADGEKAAAKAKCGDCYGAAASGRCCNTCDEVRDAYRSRGWSMPPVDTISQCNGVEAGFVAEVEQRLAAGEGCQMYGFLDVARVAGNLHFGPSHAFLRSQHRVVGSPLEFTHSAFDASHEIVRLGFGAKYPGQTNPLEVREPAGAAASAATKKKGVVFSKQGGGRGIFQYFIQVVPTEFVPLDFFGQLFGNNVIGTTPPRKKAIMTNTYSATRHFQKVESEMGGGVPGVHFKYDVSEIRARHVESRRSFSHFLTALCAIVGGVYTIVGLLDQAVHGCAEKRSGAILRR